MITIETSDGNLHSVRPCGLCGTDPARGFAAVTPNDSPTIYLCHEDGHRDCYHEWTVYGVHP